MTTTTTTHESHGLIGAIRHLHSRPLEIITALVFAAGIIAVMRVSGVGLPAWAEVAFGVLLGIAALTYEFAAVKFMTRAYYDRTLAGVAGWALVWFFAFAYSANAWLGFASSGEENKAAMQKAAFVRGTDTEQQVVELTKRNADLLQRLEMAPKRTPEAAAIAIRNSKANRFWDMTDGCTKTSGPQTRKFCDEYASAVADEAGGKQLIIDREEQKIVAKQLVDLRAKRETEGTALTQKADRTDLGILVRYAKMDERGAMDFQAVLKVIAISAFLSLTGFLIERERHHGQPRKPWPFSGMFGRIGRAFSRALFGRVHTQGMLVVNNGIDGTVAMRNPVTMEINRHRVQTA